MFGGASANFGNNQLVWQETFPLRRRIVATSFALLC